MTDEEMRLVREETERIAAEFRALCSRFALTLEQIAALPADEMRSMVLEVAAELREIGK